MGYVLKSKTSTYLYLFAQSFMSTTTVCVCVEGGAWGLNSVRMLTFEWQVKKQGNVLGIMQDVYAQLRNFVSTLTQT